MSFRATQRSRLPWYSWLLVPIAVPAALVVGIPLTIAAGLSVPYYAIYPDRHPHQVDLSGTPRQRALLTAWRVKYAKLGFAQRVGVALRGRRRRHTVVVREYKRNPNNSPETNALPGQ